MLNYAMQRQVLKPERVHGEVRLYGLERQATGGDEVLEYVGKVGTRQVVAHGIEVWLAVYEPVGVSVAQIAIVKRLDEKPTYTLNTDANTISELEWTHGRRDESGSRSVRETRRT